MFFVSFLPFFLSYHLSGSHCVVLVPETHYVNQANLKLIEIQVHLIARIEIKGMYHHACFPNSHILNIYIHNSQAFFSPQIYLYISYISKYIHQITKRYISEYTLS